MARFHTNPNTGHSDVCRAKVACPFGDMTNDHYDTVEGARSAFEDKMSSESAYAVSHKRVVAKAKPLLFGSPEARDLVGSIVGKDYATTIANAKDRASLATNYFNNAGRAPLSSVFDTHTTAAPAAVRESFHNAVAARRESSTSSKAFAGSSTPASDSVASGARDALNARSATRNPFAAGARAFGN